MNESNITQTNNYSTGLYCKYREPPLKIELDFQLATLSIVGVFGLFGNVFTIVLAAKYTVRRNLHLLIMNMAVSDTVVIICALFECFKNYYIATMDIDQTLKTLATIICLVYSVWDISQTVSFVTLVIISIERYRVTRRLAIKVVQPYSVKKSLGLILVPWLISTVINLDDAIFSYPKESGFCIMKSQFLYIAIVWFNIKFIIVFVIFGVLLSLNILTLRRLSSPQAIEDNSSAAQRQQRGKQIGSAVKMVLFSLLLYCCCILPIIAYRIVHSFSILFPSNVIEWDSCYDYDALYFVLFQFLPIINSSFSPYVYFLCLSDFRQAAKTVLCCRGNNTEN